MRRQDRNSLKDWKFIILILVEVILLGWRIADCFTSELYMENSSGDVAMPIQGGYIPLKAGYYVISLDYTAETDDASVQTRVLTSYGFVRGENILLPLNKNHVEFDIELREDTDSFSLFVEDWNDVSFNISGMGIRESRRGYMKSLLLLVCVFALVDFLYFSKKRGLFRKISAEQRETIFGLCGICLAVSLPLFINYVPAQHVINFHLMRIEGLAEALMDGVFPVKMHTGWINGYGYPASIMYGDLLLYIPAGLRIIGFSLQDAYHIYLFLINMATAVSSYYCVKMISRSRRIGLLGSLLYTWSLYRLADGYYRSAAGEFTAMAFLPLVFAGLYLLFETKEKTKGCVCMMLGFTMTLQAHLMSFEIAILFAVLYCMMNIRNVLANIGRLLATAGITLVINLGFLVPLLDYMYSQDLAVRSTMGNTMMMKQEGLFIPQLFAGFCFGGWKSEPVESGIGADMSLSLGISFLLILALWIWEIAANEKRLSETVGRACLREQKRIFVLWMLSLWMCCYFFPWNVVGTIPVLGKYLTVFQFAWRFLGIGAVLGLMLAGHAFGNLREIVGRESRIAVAIGVGIVVFINGTYFLNYAVTEYTRAVIVSAAGINDLYCSGNEFLLEGTDVSACYIDVAAGEAVQVDGLTEERGDYIVTCSNHFEDASWIEIPRFIYKGYIAMDTASGERFETMAGDNNKIRVLLPAGYEGSIRVKFRQPLLWIVSELVSAAGVIAVAVWLLRKKLSQFVKVKNIQ